MTKVGSREARTSVTRSDLPVRDVRKHRIVILATTHSRSTTGTMGRSCPCGAHSKGPLSRTWRVIILEGADHQFFIRCATGHPPPLHIFWASCQFSLHSYPERPRPSCDSNSPLSLTLVAPSVSCASLLAHELRHPISDCCGDASRACAAVDIQAAINQGRTGDVSRQVNHPNMCALFLICSLSAANTPISLTPMVSLSTFLLDARLRSLSRCLSSHTGGVPDRVVYEYAIHVSTEGESSAHPFFSAFFDDFYGRVTHAGAGGSGFVHCRRWSCLLLVNCLLGQRASESRPVDTWTNQTRSRALGCVPNTTARVNRLVVNR